MSTLNIYENGKHIAKRIDRKWLLRGGSVFSFLIIWQFFGSQDEVVLFSPPVAITEALIQEVVISQTLLWAIGEALVHGTIGFILAVFFGVPIGIITGLWEPANNVISPLVDALYATPMVALVPLIIIWFGTGITAKAFLVFILAIFVVIVNSEAGVQETPEGLIDAATIYGANSWQLYRRVHLQNALPHILTGIRLAAGRSVRAMVVAELFIVAGPLGEYLIDSGARFETTNLLAAIALLSVLGVIAVSIVRYIESRLLAYRISS